MVDKFTKPPYGEKVVDKINEIIDNLGSSGITVDDELSTTSENPVQNKVITTELNKKIDNVATGTGSISINSNDTTTNNSISIGCNNGHGAYTYNAVAIGNSSHIYGNAPFSVAIGNNANISASAQGSTVIGGYASTEATNSTAIGYSANCATKSGGTAIGADSYTSGQNAIAIGYTAVVNQADNAIQLGYGTNTTASTFNVGFGSSNNYQLLDGTTGLIPDARISSNIARTSQIPTESTVSGWGFTKNTGTVTSVNNVQPDSSGNVTISVSGGANTDLSNLTSTGNNLVNTALNTRDNSTRLKFWTGTKAQYDAISTKDSNTLYNITDDQDITLTLLQTIYPVGSVYLSTNATCPLASLFGTWRLVSSGKALWTGTGSNGGTTISAGLPNITGNTQNAVISGGSNGTYTNGAFTEKRTTGGVGTGSSFRNDVLSFDASHSNSIYGNSTTVQPPAYVVNVWRRTA